MGLRRWAQATTIPLQRKPTVVPVRMFVCAAHASTHRHTMRHMGYTYTRDSKHINFGSKYPSLCLQKGAQIDNWKSKN